jgi:hypothetical protein
MTFSFLQPLTKSRFLMSVIKQVLIFRHIKLTKHRQQDDGLPLQQDPLCSKESTQSYTFTKLDNLILYNPNSWPGSSVGRAED